MCTVAGCGNLIGLGGYSVADERADAGGAGTANNAGSGVDGGSAGQESGEGGTSGAPEADAGSAGASGSEETGGSAGTSGSIGTSGSAGSGGGPASCPAGCDDSNDCTSDSCVLGACAHEPRALGAACGVARSCDAQAVCVRCRDTAAGSAQDLGCSASAPVCQGTGLDAACAGCTVATDCNDGNDCTTEVCTTGKCVFTAVAAGTACATGVCNGTVLAEKCVGCTDNAAGSSQDAGCTAGKPVCEASGTPTCYECLNNSDCQTDNVSCTVETCTNHVCSHVATDSQCPASGDVCKPNKCDAVVSCKQVDISSLSSIIGTAVDGGNGGFEKTTQVVAPPKEAWAADGWLETGDYYIIYQCGSAGCTGNNGTTYPQSPLSVGGTFVGWTGSQLDSGVTELYRAISFPVGTTKVSVLVDINFQTQNATSTNHDYFEVRLLDSNLVQNGTPLAALSNMNAQTGTARAWTKDGINATRDASALAGKAAFLMFWTNVDSTLRSDFFFDNVRVIATVCK